MQRLKQAFFYSAYLLWRLSRVVAVGLVAGCLLLLMLLMLTQPTQARQASQAPIVSLDKLPEIGIQISCTAQTSVPSSFVLTEDGQPLALSQDPARETRLPATETIFLFDLTAGSEGLIPSIGDALNRFFVYYKKSGLANQRNQFAAFAPSADGQTLDEISSWTPQLGELIDRVNQFKLKAPANTALIGLIDNAHHKFAPDMNAQRTIVVFSDGLDGATLKNLAQTLRALRADQVVVHTIFMPTTSGNKGTLQTIATQSDGEFITHINKAADVDILLSTLVQPEHFCTLTYRTAKAHPMQVVVQELISATIVATTPVTIPFISVTGPVVTIVTDTQTNNVVRDVNLSTQTLDLPIQWKFSDYTNRQVQTVTYTLFGLNRQVLTSTRTLTANASVSLPIPIHQLSVGSYSLQVEVQDDIGLKGRLVAPFTLLLPTPIPTAMPPAPPAPVPPPTPTLTFFQGTKQALDEINPYSNIIFLVTAFVLFLGLCGLAIWLARLYTRYREERDRGASSPGAIAPPVSALLYRIRSRPDFPLLQVIKLDRNIHLPKDLLVIAKPATHAKNLEKIQDLINFRVDIEKRSNQEFRLYYREDETPIAQVKIQSNGGNVEDLKRGSVMYLKHEDVIQLGSVHYRFLDLSQRNNSTLSGNNLATPSTPGNP